MELGVDFEELLLIELHTGETIQEHLKGAVVDLICDLQPFIDKNAIFQAMRSELGLGNAQEDRHNMNALLIELVSWFFDTQHRRIDE